MSKTVADFMAEKGWGDDVLYAVGHEVIYYLYLRWIGFEQEQANREVMAVHDIPLVELGDALEHARESGLEFEL